MLFIFFFFKQKTAYEMRISDWSSDVCSSDLRGGKQEPHLHRYIELQTGQQSTGSHRGEPERRIERGERGGFFAMEDVFQPALVHGCREFPAVPDGTGAAMEPGRVVQCAGQVEGSLQVRALLRAVEPARRTAQRGAAGPHVHPV